MSKEVDVPAEVAVQGEEASLRAEFPVTIEDFKVEIPGTVREKIDAEAKIIVDCTMKLRK